MAPSATVAQSGRDAIDRDEQRALHAVVRVARAQAPQELDLQVVERVDVGAPVADRARERWIALEQSLGALDCEQVVYRQRLFLFDTAKQVPRAFLVLREARVARGDAKVGL